MRINNEFQVLNILRKDFIQNEVELENQHSKLDYRFGLKTRLLTQPMNLQMNHSRTPDFGQS